MDMTQIPLPSSADAEHAQSDLDRNDNTRQIVADVPIVSSRSST